MKDFQKVTTSDNKDLELMALREGVPQHSDSILYKSNNCTNELVRPPMQSCCITTFSLGSWICKFPAHLCGRMCPVLFGTKLNCLLLCVPFAVIGVSFGILGHSWVFLLSLLGMMPLAERLGFVTEQLSCCTGATVGGLLNATFGNATEVIICVMALRKNMIRVVQLSLLGSILSNMLLVLGCAFFFGGLKHPQTDQKFNKVTAQVSASLLLMAVMGLLFPVVLHATGTELQMGKSELVLSRFSSIVMLVAYIAYLYFQLKSHKELYDSEEDCGGNDAVSDDDEAVLDFWTSIAWLTVLTIFISILSEYLVDAIEVYDGLISSLNFKLSFVCYSSKLSCGRVIQYALRNGNLDLGATKRFAWTISVHVMLVCSLCLLSGVQGTSSSWNVPIAFISVILLPIVGNAAEHASAVMFALKDKLDISLGVAIGSSTQISMFVIPFCVVIGWPMGTHMDLNFELFETATLFITVLVVALMLQEGTSNYFKGLMLILCYLIVGASFFVHVDTPDEHSGT